MKLPSDLPSDAALWRALLHLAPALGAWVVSFAFVLTFWVSHHYLFASLKHADRGLLWLNGLFLLTITLLPFPTALVGQYPAFTAPLALLSAAMFAASLSFALMRLYATVRARLLRDQISHRQAHAALFQSAIAPLLYAVATGLAFAWPAGTVLILILVLALFFMRTAHAPEKLEPG